MAKRRKTSSLTGMQKKVDTLKQRNIDEAKKIRLQKQYEKELGKAAKLKEGKLPSKRKKAPAKKAAKRRRR
jgi:hypothetical protein